MVINNLEIDRGISIDEAAMRAQAVIDTANPSRLRQRGVLYQASVVSETETEIDRVKRHVRKWGVQNPDAVRHAPPPGAYIGFVNYGAAAERYRQERVGERIEREE